MQLANNAGPDQPAYSRADQSFHCTPTEPLDIVVHVAEQRMFRSDCSDVHAQLDFRCLHMAKRPFSHAEQHYIIIFQ